MPGGFEGVQISTYQNRFELIDSSDTAAGEIGCDFVEFLAIVADSSGCEAHGAAGLEL